MDFKIAGEQLSNEFGLPKDDLVKVKRWSTCGVPIVLQVDQPRRDSAAYIWLPYPPAGATIPKIALEYLGESGRHSGTYTAGGLEKGNPALKLVVRTARELARTVEYIRALAAKLPLPTVEAEPIEESPLIPVGPLATAVETAAKSPQREAIPREVQREIWRRDEGRCVECSSKEKLCFDHIIPFSRGGSNTSRNLQLLCERCNLSKGNRI